jgi:hypothetical protein
MKRLLTTVCLVLALGGIVLLLARRTRGPGQASLLLLGVTNLPSGNFAVFCLSNGSGIDIACVPEALEQASANTWTRTPLTGRASLAVRDWIGVPEEVKPGQSVTFMVPPPSTNKSWRLVFLCQERARLIDPVTDTVHHLTDTNAMQTQGRQFSGRRYYATSPEFVQ